MSWEELGGTTTHRMAYNIIFINPGTASGERRSKPWRKVLYQVRIVMVIQHSLRGCYLPGEVLTLFRAVLRRRAFHDLCHSWLFPGHRESLWLKPAVALVAAVRLEFYINDVRPFQVGAQGASQMLECCPFIPTALVESRFHHFHLSITGTMKSRASICHPSAFLTRGSLAFFSLMLFLTLHSTFSSRVVFSRSAISAPISWYPSGTIPLSWLKLGFPRGHLLTH